MTVPVLAPPASPYKGLAAFEDSDLDALLFFGREREQEIITANLLAYRLTVLYGASGVGKSSVLRAGVAHGLRGRGDVVVVFSSWSGDPVAGILEELHAALVERYGEELVSPPAETLVDSFAAWCAELDCELYVILDQVDEYFLYHDDDAFEVEFAEAATRGGLHVNFLLAIREDMLAKLDRFKARIPNLLSNYLRLDHLDREAARAAIVGPVERWNEMVRPDEPVRVSPQLVEAVLDQTVAGRVEFAEGAGSDLRSVEAGLVEAPFLQLVMQRLWEERDARSGRLEVSTLEELGGAEEIVRAHLRDALDGLSRDEQDLAASLFNHLVTPSGTKIAHGVGDLAQYAAVSEGDVLPVLSLLVGERILRPVTETRDPEGARFEIFHDVLAEPVSLWRARHDADRELERQRKESERRHRRLLAVAIVSFASVGLMALVATYALVQRSDAKEQARRAQGQALLAEANRYVATDPIHALHSAVNGARVDPGPEAERALRAALGAFRLRNLETVGNGNVVAVDFARTGSLGVAASRDGNALIFGPTGDPVARVRHGSPIVGAGITNDGAAVFTAGADASLIHWSPRTGRRLETVRLGNRVTYAATEHNDLIGDRSGAVRKVSPEMSHSTDVSTPEPVRQALVDDRGRVLLVVDTSGAARIYDLPSGRLGRLHVSRGVTTTALSSDGRYAATGGLDGVIRLWRVRTGRPGPELRGHTLGITDLEFWKSTSCPASPEPDPFCDILVSSSLDGTARVWGVPQGEHLTQLVAHTDFVDRVAVSRLGDVVATTSRDETVRLWRTRSGQAVGLLPRYATDLAFAPAGTVLATGGQAGRVGLWDASADAHLTVLGHVGEPVDEIEAFDGRILGVDVAGNAALWRKPHKRPVRTSVGRPVLAATVGVRPLVLVRDQGPVVRDVPGGREVRRLPHPGEPVLTGALDAAGWAATANSTDVRVWDGAGHHVATIDAPPGVTALALSADHSRLAAGGYDGTVWVWEVPSGRPLKTLEGHLHEITSVEFSAGGGMLVTTAMSPDNDARIWDTRTWRQLQRVRHSGMVADAAFDPTGRWLATAGPVSVGIWEVALGENLFRVRSTHGQVSDVAWSPGNRVLAGTAEGDVSMYVCSLCGRTPELLRMAESLLDRTRPADPAWTEDG